VFVKINIMKMVYRNVNHVNQMELKLFKNVNIKIQLMEYGHMEKNVMMVMMY
jgi:hypothetical protein